MIFRMRADVHDWRSFFSRSMTAALQANSIVARIPKSVFANGQIFVVQVIRWFLYCSNIWLGCGCAMSGMPQAHARAMTVAQRIHRDVASLVIEDTRLL